jgi:hypothetical protein
VKAALDLAFEKRAEEPSGGMKALLSWLYPGLALDKTIPGAGFANMAVAGGVGGLGAFAGYQAARDPEGAKAVRRRVKAMDLANATEVQPPMIARLTPVPRAT